MRRFLIDPISANQKTIRLDREESHHISKVLRLQKGAGLELFDSQGMVYQATISEIGKYVEVNIESVHESQAPRPYIHLHLGLLKGKKMDFIVQKATELGVHALQPFTSEFTEASLPKEQKKERWHKISLEACKQCGRNWPLSIKEPTPLRDQIEALPQNTPAFLFWEDETEADPAALPPLNEMEELHLFIGPEGGFSAAEVSFCKPQMTTLSLGPLTLRAETAVITALSLALFLTGRMQHQP